MRGVVLELIELTWELPCLWEKVILLRECFVHAHQVFGQVMFLAQALNPRVHVHFLPRVELRKEILGHPCVVPRQVVGVRKGLAALSFVDSAVAVFFVGF